MSAVRVLVADDHTVVRRGLCRMLESEPTIDVVGEVGDGAAAVAAARRLTPDIVIMDVAMPVMNGIEAARQIAAAQPEIRVLMLSMYDDAQYVRESWGAGAVGYLLKDSADLVDAVLTVSNGGTYFTHLDPRDGNGGPEPGAGLDGLSKREVEVLILLAQGNSNREVAAILRISVHTVDTHRKHIMEKLGIHSIQELVRYAAKHGLLPD